MSEQTRKRRPKGLQASTNVSARLTPGEHAALGQLIARRVAEMEARSEPGDPSFVGWLRWIIRREAKAAGIQLASNGLPEDKKR